MQKISFNLWNVVQRKNLNLVSYAKNKRPTESENLSCKDLFNPFPYNDTFRRPLETSVLKTPWEKEKLLVTSKFLLFPQCFLPIWITFCHFRQI